MKLELRSLRVQDCGPLRDVCIDFCDAQGKPRPVTVLAGANGSGKTTILELIASLAELLLPQYMFLIAPMHWNTREGVPSFLHRVRDARLDLLVDEQEFTLYYGEKPSDRIPWQQQYGRSAPVLVPPQQNGQKSPQQASDDGVDLQIEQGRIFGHQTVAGKLMLAIFEKLNASVNLQPDSISLPSILYFPHLRFLEPVVGDQVVREDTRYEWVYRFKSQSAFAGSLGSYLIWLDYAEPEVFRTVIEFLNDLDFDGKTFGVIRKELKAVVTTRDGRTHDIADLSSGEQNILIMLLELRRRLLPHSIVLIDEIENSLHPAFQYRLAQSLKRMQEKTPFQLIVTTHAPAIVEVFGADSTLILTEF